MPANVLIFTQHAFHESCLSRSVMSQVYVCPHPDCGHVLFPGLHHLVVKDKKQMNDPNEPRLEAQDMKEALPALNCAFSVLSLQQRGGPRAQQQAIPQATDKKLKRKTDSEHCRNDGGKLPAMQGLEAVGLLSLGRSGPKSGSTNNQIDEESTDRHRQRKPSTSHSSVRHSRVVSTLRRNAATSIPQSRDAQKLPALGIGNNFAIDRMDQAERTRVELQNNEKDRLRKQRLQREERTRIRNTAPDNSSGMFGEISVNSFAEAASLDAKLSKAEENRSATQKRSQDERERKRKIKDDQQRKHQQLLQHSDVSPDMFIGVQR